MKKHEFLLQYKEKEALLTVVRARLLEKGIKDSDIDEFNYLMSRCYELGCFHAIQQFREDTMYSELSEKKGKKLPRVERLKRGSSVVEL